MLDGLKALFGSKKFWLSTIVAPIVLGLTAAVLPVVGVGPDLVHTILTWLGGILGTGVAGIGAADFGKEAAKLSNGD